MSRVVSVFLFTNMGADLIELEADSRDRIAPCPKMFACKVAIALFPFRKPIIEATACSGGISIHIGT
jgi:hypothetical protein